MGVAPALTAGTAMAAHAPSGRDIYVSASGSDRNSGHSTRQPLLTLAAAQAAARKASRAGHPVHVWVRGGTCHLAATLKFSAADSGSTSAPVAYSSYPGERAVLSGGRRVTAAWKTDRQNDTIRVADIGAHRKIDGLFVGGTRQVLARYPDKYTADRNLFWANGGPVALPGVWSAAALDTHSVTADPRFAGGSPWDSPGMTDYTPVADSPARTLGFVSFPMNRFGTGRKGEATPPTRSNGLPPRSPTP
ncbi:hypothetical protein ACIQM0_14820 [Streptomyces sp. NPDC091387]|uniref:hypothetical protein n=1 Tax=Streptomyces sp. NPDC091387 TaxID=3365998 RepID=UPI003830249B